MTLVAEIPADPTDPAWHEARRSFLGASDAPKILGLSPWGNALDVWCEKHGLIPPMAATLSTDLGHELEDLIARRWVAAGAGRGVLNPRTTVRHPDIPHIAASIDRRTLTGELLECKYVGPTTAHEWAGGPPLHVLAQVQVQMAVTGAPRTHVCALMIDRAAGWHTWPIDRDEQAITTIIGRLDRWWQDHIVGGTRPDLDGDPWDIRDTLGRIWTGDTGTPVRLSGAALDLVASIKHSKALAKDLDGQILAAENELRAELGDATDGFADDNSKPVVTWRPQTRTSWATKDILAGTVEGFTDDELAIAARVLRAVEQFTTTRVLKIK